MRLLFPSSNVPSNIGNGFFYVGLRHALGLVAPQVSLLEIPFPPTNPFSLNAKEQSRVWQPEYAKGSYDGVLIAGPVIDSNFVQQHGPLLRRAREHGKQVIMISIGARAYDANESNICGSFLAELKPDLFISRDRDTFDAYGGFAKMAHNGICFAFFCADGHKAPLVSPDRPYVAATFDFASEPVLEDHIVIGETGKPEIYKAIEPYGTRSSLGKVAMITQRRFSPGFNGMPIVRASHKPTRPKWMIFHKPNAFADLGVSSYLNLYASAEFTITDRLHAAVAAMAFGRPAHLVLRSSRTRLLEAAGVDEVTKDFATLDEARLSKIKNTQLDVLTEYFDRF